MLQQLKQVIIYCDGACSGNPGPGGWGAILMYRDSKKEIAGFAESTTNNRMELIACIEALKALKQPCEVSVYTDSAYVSNAFLKNWLVSWKRNGWRKADKKPVENSELWQALDGLVAKHHVTFFKVKGHSDNEWNNRADHLATEQIKLLKNQSMAQVQSSS